MQDLVLKSHKHQRYENGRPTMGIQLCGRAITVENKRFSDIFGGMDIEPEEGFLVRMFNLDLPLGNGNFQPMMKPKLMVIESESYDQIKLRGARLKTMGIMVPDCDFSDYALTLRLVNRKVNTAILHMLDRNIEIEYRDIE